MSASKCQNAYIGGQAHPCLAERANLVQFGRSAAAPLLFVSLVVFGRAWARIEGTHSQLDQELGMCTCACSCLYECVCTYAHACICARESVCMCVCVRCRAAWWPV